MSDLLKKIETVLSNQPLEEMKHTFKKVKTNVPNLIKELMHNDFGNGKKMQMQAAGKIMALARSSHPASNAFMRGLDKAATVIGEKLLDKMKAGHFAEKE